MNTLLLEPTDTLFFRDGRPMSGSLAGHGTAWPLPTVTSAALHAALHRADIQGTHAHRRGRSGKVEDTRDRLFGSLLTAGPFPVSPDGTWFFPRPADAQQQGTTRITLQPTPRTHPCSLPHPWLHPVANTHPPTKANPEPWLSHTAYRHYLDQSDPSNPSDLFLTDTTFSDTEHTIGIAIDPNTGTTGQGEAEGKIYSAHSLRLRPGWRLGLLATAHDKDLQADLLHTLFPNSGSRTPIIVGGQQRLCTVLRDQPATLPLPTAPTITGTRVKWVLLTPTIFPQIGDHPGGWLPSWVDLNGRVQLLDGPGKNYARRHKVPEGKPIPARLVAAVVHKSLPVTGYALPNEADPDRTQGGAKSTHLAVPAGAVYYFEAETPEAAQALATALNWHGDTPGTHLRNRRSTLFGEKGFGLGLCAPWQYFPNPSDQSDPSHL